MKKISKFMFTFCLAGLLFTSCGEKKASTPVDEEKEETTEIETEEEEVIPSKEIEAIVLHFSSKKSEAGNEYENVYKVTLHMNGNAEIHSLEHFIMYGRIEDDETDFQGAWALRHKLRGANYVDYYDIEFNNGFRDKNWCVDSDCKFIYFNWDAFDKRNADYEHAITKIDTLYVD